MFTRTVGNICLSARSNNRHVADHCVHRWDTMLCSTLTAYFLHLMCKSNLVSDNSILYFQFVPRRFIGRTFLTYSGILSMNLAGAGVDSWWQLNPGLAVSIQAFPVIFSMLAIIACIGETHCCHTNTTLWVTWFISDLSTTSVLKIDFCLFSWPSCSWMIWAEHSRRVVECSVGCCRFRCGLCGLLGWIYQAIWSALIIARLLHA